MECSSTAGQSRFRPQLDRVQPGLVEPDRLEPKGVRAVEGIDLGEPVVGRALPEVQGLAEQAHRVRRLCGPGGGQ